VKRCVLNETAQKRLTVLVNPVKTMGVMSQAVETQERVKLISVAEFARRVGLRLRGELARKLVNNGAIPSVRVGCRRRVSSRWVEEWLAKAERGQAA
jgi:excisionase family DNA binding protein